MGVDYSHTHAAALATQLPKDSRCLASEDPHDKWDDHMWMLWRIEYNTRLSRYGLGVRSENESVPQLLPYPGKELDEHYAQIRLEENKSKVKKAYGL